MEIPKCVCRQPDFTWTCKPLESVKVTWQSDFFFWVFGAFFFAMRLGIFQAPQAQISPFALLEEGKGVEDSKCISTSLQWTLFNLIQCLLGCLFAQQFKISVENGVERFKISVERCLKPSRQKICMLTRIVVQSVCNPNVAVPNFKKT